MMVFNWIFSVVLAIMAFNISAMYAYNREEFDRHTDRENFSDSVLTGFMLSLLGPVGLLAVFCMTDFYKYGFDIPHISDL